MPRSIEAIAKPEMLAWSRKTAGLDIATAARKLGITEERLRSWEEGTAYATIAKLRKAAQVYRRPLAVFYLPHPPKDFTPLRDFRRLPHDVPRPFSPALRFLIRRVRERQEWIIEARRALGRRPLTFVGCVRRPIPATEIAERIRGVLELDTEGRERWRTADEALRYWIDRVEQAGAFVFQSTDVDVVEMRGFALVDALAPAIGVNARDARSARVFTLLHEFAHLVLGEEGISNLDVPPRARSQEQRIEALCNAAAAEVLLPEHRLRDVLRKRHASGQPDELIESLAKAHKVSREVVARRMLDVGHVDRGFYEAKRRQYRLEFEEVRRRFSGEYAIPHARLVLRDNGRAFTRSVLEAYGNDTITAPDLSNLLNVKLKHLPRIEAEVLPVAAAQDRR